MYGSSQYAFIGRELFLCLSFEKKVEAVDPSELVDSDGLYTEQKKIRKINHKKNHKKKKGKEKPQKKTENLDRIADQVYHVYHRWNPTQGLFKTQCHYSVNIQKVNRKEHHNKKSQRKQEEQSTGK